MTVSKAYMHGHMAYHLFDSYDDNHLGLLDVKEYNYEKATILLFINMSILCLILSFLF